MMNMDSIVDQSTLDELRFNLVQYIRPVAFTTQDIVNLEPSSSQSLRQLEGSNATTRDQGGMPASGFSKQNPGIAQVIKFIHAIEVSTGNFEWNCLGTCGDQQLIIGQMGGSIQQDSLFSGQNTLNTRSKKLRPKILII